MPVTYDLKQHLLMAIVTDVMIVLNLSQPEQRNISSFSGSPLYLEQKMAAIQDPNLKARAGTLQTLIQARWACSTTKKYRTAWSKWMIWCGKLPESKARPADRFYIALYINDLATEGCKHGALEAASAGIRWGHVMTGLTNPMVDLLIKTVLRGPSAPSERKKGADKRSLCPRKWRSR